MTHPNGGKRDEQHPNRKVAADRFWAAAPVWDGGSKLCDDCLSFYTSTMKGEEGLAEHGPAPRRRPGW